MVVAVLERGVYRGRCYIHTRGVLLCMVHTNPFPARSLLTDSSIEELTK